MFGCRHCLKKSGSEEAVQSKDMPCPTYSVSEMQVFARCDDGKTHTESAAG